MSMIKINIKLGIPIVFFAGKESVEKMVIEYKFNVK